MVELGVSCFGCKILRSTYSCSAKFFFVANIAHSEERFPLLHPSYGRPYCKGQSRQRYSKDHYPKADAVYERPWPDLILKPAMPVLTCLSNHQPSSP